MRGIRSSRLELETSLRRDDRQAEEAEGEVIGGLIDHSSFEAAEGSERGLALQLLVG